MKVCRAMFVLSVMAVLVGGFGCCSKTPVETDNQTTPVVETLDQVTSKVVFIRTIDGDPDRCILVPEELHMGASGIEWVTFVNETTYDAKIKFQAEAAIQNVAIQTVNANQAVSFRLFSPTGNQTHTYTVDSDCYEGDIAGPKIIIP